MDKPAGQAFRGWCDSPLSLGYEDQPQGLTAGSRVLDNKQRLDNFLSSVEKKAFHRARLATRNTEEALDIVQDAMFKLVKKYAAEEAQAWEALFNRILQNCIMDWHRRTTVRNRFRGWFGRDDTGEGTEDEVQTAEDTDGHGPERLSQGQRTLESLQDLLQELPLRQQQVFLLRAWEELSVKETARAMGCSEGTVKTHYSRARTFLKERLTQIDEQWL